MAGITLHRKLVRIVLLVSGAVLLLASTAILTYAFLGFRDATIRQASTLGQIIAANTTAALAFDNRDDAVEILSAVKSEQSIVAVALYDKEGRLFSYYPPGSTQSNFPSMPQRDGYRFADSRLVSFQPVAQGDKRLGTLYLEWDLKPLYTRFLPYGVMIVAIMAACLLGAAYVLSKTLRRQVSQPILALAETARAVSDKQDYSVRARNLSDIDELSLFTNVFNHMLGRAQEQTSALIASEQRVRAVLQSAMTAVIVIDTKGKILEWNARAESMFGWTSAEAIGQEVAEKIIPPRFRDQHRLGLNRFLKTRDAPVLNRVLEMTALRRDGTEFPVELSIAQVETDGLTTFCGFVTDITERREAAEKLETQLNRMQLLERITRAQAKRQDLPSMFQVVIGSLERDMPIDFGCFCLYEEAENALIVTHVGAKSQDLAAHLGIQNNARIPLDSNGISKCVRGSLVYEPDVQEVPSPFSQRLAAGGFRSLVAAPLAADNHVFGVLMAARHAPYSFSSPDCEFIRHLTEHVALAAHQARLYARLQEAYDDLRQTQQAMMQQERLRALGQMASGIAHDINNAISPVALYMEALLEKEPNLSERARSYLEITKHAVDDIAHTVSRMREFYRQREPQLTLAPVQLNDLVRQVKDLTHVRWSDIPQQRGLVIEVAMELEPDLPTIMGVENEIRDALVNLIFNAVDAMPEGGNVTMRTHSNGKFVYVEVSDIGTGMDQATKLRCLEPFFTTKGERGTGLGLAMVYGMAQRHDAEIEIDSEPGRGTTMRLVLPFSEGRLVAPTAASTAPIQPRNLLIVDDDPLIIHALREVLEGDGHAVTSAGGGQEGIDAFQSACDQGKPFFAVITDLGMPFVDGRKVAAAVKARSPQTPVILFTGWGQRFADEQDIPQHVDRVLNKPPKLRELRAALAELTALAR